MTIRVLVVDDSRFIRKRIQEILEEESTFQVVGTAGNGREAVELAAQLEPDVITMDVEMPVMDGITAVKQIMRDCPAPILMFSIATRVGAQATLDALNAGAIDFLPKQLDDIDGNREMAKRLLRRRIRIVAQQAQRIRKQAAAAPQVRPVTAPATAIAGRRDRVRPDLLLVAASTGGPVAIQKILTQIPAHCSVPILLVQHMPENFTKSFAERLNELCKIRVKQAEQGELLQPGLALLGPGGMQMELEYRHGTHCINLRRKASGEIYSPCVDITFASVARQQMGKVLAVVLTGMGADGRKGAEQLKRKGAEIWAQDESSCTIYGMPKAVAEAGLADHVYSLDEIAFELNKLG